MSEEIVTQYKGRGRPRKTDEVIKEPEPTYIENPKEELRRLCEKDFYSFIRTVATRIARNGRVRTEEESG